MINDQKVLLGKAEGKLHFLRGVKSKLESDLEKNKTQLIDIEKKELLYAKTHSFLSVVSEKARKSVVVSIETLVTEGLQEILQDSNIKFKIIIDSKRGVTGVEFKLCDEETGAQLDIQKSEAGAVKDLTGALLRLVVLELTYPRIEGPIVLDEVGKNVPPAYQGNFAKFLRKFSETTGRQIILVSHEDALIEEAHRVIHLSRLSGKTIAKYNK